MIEKSPKFLIDSTKLCVSRYSEPENSYNENDPELEIVILDKRDMKTYRWIDETKNWEVFGSNSPVSGSVGTCSEQAENRA